MKTAKWIEKTHLFRPDEYVCSACGASFRKPAPACPHCGVKMNGGKYDPHHIDELEAMDMLFGD